MIDKKIAAGSVLTVLLMAVIILACATLGHCAVSGRAPSSIGNVVYQENPLTYKAGNLTDYAFIGKTGLVLTIQPVGTYSLFQESILVCNSKETGDLITGKKNPMVFAYKTRASRLVEGVGCHELVRVYEIK